MLVAGSYRNDDEINPFLPNCRNPLATGLRNPRPLLHVFGPREITIKGRPRVDVIPALVAEAIGVDPKSSRFRVDPPSGGVERLQAAG